MRQRSNVCRSSCLLAALGRAVEGATTDAEGRMAVTYQKVVKLPVGKIRPLEQDDGGLQNLGL